MDLNAYRQTTRQPGSTGRGHRDYSHLPAREEIRDAPEGGPVLVGMSSSTAFERERRVLTLSNSISTLGRASAA